MRLPKVLALAVGSVLVAGSASALTLSQFASGDPSHPAAAVRIAGPLAVGTGRTGTQGTTGTGQSGTGQSGTGQSGTVAAAESAAAATGVPTADPYGGLAVPAAGVPLASGTGPAPQAAVAAATGAPGVVLPTPDAKTLPTVAALGHQVTPDAVVLLNSSLGPNQLQLLSKLRGVASIETVDTGTVSMGGTPVVAFGVDPGSFRNYTPAASAASDQLWRYLAGGSLVSSYDMADGQGLKLGSTQLVRPAAGAGAAAPVQGWLGAIASIGLPGVDLLVDHVYSADLGLTPASGMVVSAPDLSGSALQQEIREALPGATVELLHPDQLPENLPGNTLSTATRQKIIAAALSRVGLPYVWGGAGPNSFDCSGLVQWAYRQAGVLMPRVAAEQFLTGDHIPLADAQPGDLLFWTYDPTDPGYVDHTAIYLGNGMMVVAPYTGTNVQVDPVPTDQFAGAVAVVLASS